MAASLGELGDYAGPKNVTVLIESHGDLTDSPTLRGVLEKPDSPHVRRLWDAHHTYVTSKEHPAVTISKLRKYIRHTHSNHSRLKGDRVHYLLTSPPHV